MAYTVNPMLVKGKQDRSAGYWGAIVGSLLSGAGTGIGTALGGPAGGAVGGIIGGSAGNVAGGMTTQAMDDSTPDKYTSQPQAYSPTQNPAFIELLRRYGLHA